jgi:tripartite motif-containing protein 71
MLSIALTKFLELRSQDIEVLFDKGIIYEILKKFDKAIECYNKVISIDPYDIDAKNKIDILSSISYFPNVKSTRTETYKAVAIWGSKGSGDGQFDSPRGMAVNHRGTIFQADSGNHRIQKFDSDGNFVIKWGSKGSGDGLFYYPKCIAIDSKGYVYVSDRSGHRIQKFDIYGHFVSKLGLPYIDFSIKVKIDKYGNIYVWYNHRIQKFDSDGNFITKWSNISTENDTSFCPELTSVDNIENVYTYDSSSNQIVKFSLEQ